MLNTSRSGDLWFFVHQAAARADGLEDAFVTPFLIVARALLEWLEDEVDVSRPQFEKYRNAIPARINRSELMSDFRDAVAQAARLSHTSSERYVANVLVRYLENYGYEISPQVAEKYKIGRGIRIK